MTHPDTFFVDTMLAGVVGIQLASAGCSDDHAAVLPAICGLMYDATKLLHHELHSVADAQHGYVIAVAVLKKACWHPGSTLNVHRIRAA